MGRRWLDITRWFSVARLIQNYVKSGQYLADIIPSQLKAELHVDCLSLITVLRQTGEGEQEQWS